MRKIQATIAFLLCCIIMFTCLPVKAESCYVALRELMNSKDQENWYLGKGKSSSAQASKDIYAVYVEKDESFYILGINEYGKGEITIWKNISYFQGYFMIYHLCSIWDALQENMDAGYSIQIGITDMENIEGDWVIDDEESAMTFIQIIEKTYDSVMGS